MHRPCASPGLSLKLEMSFYQMLRKLEVPSDSHTWVGCFPKAALQVVPDRTIHIGLHNNHNEPCTNLHIKFTSITMKESCLIGPWTSAYTIARMNRTQAYILNIQELPRKKSALHPWSSPECRHLVWTMKWPRLVILEITKSETKFTTHVHTSTSVPSPTRSIRQTRRPQLGSPSRRSSCTRPWYSGEMKRRERSEGPGFKLPYR